MNKRKVTLIAFALVVMAQLYVPASMIAEQERISSLGQEFKFRTAAIDPNDPFRGKYVVINFDATTIPVEDESEWTRGNIAYITIETDSDGFARPVKAAKSVPDDLENYLKVKVAWATTDGSNQIEVEYPFDRFYMNEVKAPVAEQKYFEAARDTSQVTYAIVSIKDGDGVLKDVKINEISLRDL